MNLYAKEITSLDILFSWLFSFGHRVLASINSK